MRPLLHAVGIGMKSAFQRLPLAVKPRHYALTLTPDLEKFTFAGHEFVDVDVKEATKSLTLNAVDLQISAASFSAGDAGDVAAAVTYQPESETVQFTFPKELTPGTGRLSITFTGELNDKLKGFYRTAYTDDKGEKRYAATTQFEPTDARRAFPCWDEPAVKATFGVTLTVPKDRVALSNMPPIRETTEGAMKTIEYDTTPRMSTYLLAFIVGDFDYVEGKDADGILVRVYTQRGRSSQGQFALDVSLRTLPFYREYFGIAYPLPKMDLIAIPDFAAGAMENWGLVTYRDTAVLVDGANSSLSTKQYVAIVVCHELAHQWFGNLVTMEWWTHLWLNEGFATWIEYFCVDHLFPEWDIWSIFLSSEYARGISLDSLENSHPVEVKVNDPSEIDEIFDAISYCKGGSIIRMMHDFIGNDAFRSGLANYLEKHKYSNTVTEQLWAELETTSKREIGRIMGAFTGQTGYPLIRVSLDDSSGEARVRLEQRRFLATGNVKDESVWPVPLTGVDASGKRVLEMILEERTKTVAVPYDSWFKLNAGTVGFYRCAYSPPLLEKLATAVRERALSPRDRFGLQNDLVALCRAGLAHSLDELLTFLLNYQDETDFSVWQDVAASHSAVGTLAQNTEFADKFDAFTRKLFTKLHARLGWSPLATDTPNDPMLRALAVSKLGSAGDETVIAGARERLDTKMDADLAGAVYGVVAHSGDAATYEKLLARYNSEELHEEKMRLLRALGRHKQIELKTRYLDWGLSDEVRSQDTFAVVASAATCPASRQQAWKWLQTNWDTLSTRYPGGFLLGRFISASATKIFTLDTAAEIEAFFATRPAPGAERTILQVREAIAVQAAWLAREKDNLAKFLN